jgi:hypothetical protein
MSGDRTETGVDITDLIRQRDALNRQISAATESGNEAYADQLDVLQQAMEGFAERRNLPVTASGRKNVQMFTIEGWLSIQFGYPHDGCSPFLSIRTTGGIIADWRDKLPPLAAFAGYLEGLVEYDRDTTGER